MIFNVVRDVAVALGDEATPEEVARACAECLRDLELSIGMRLLAVMTDRQKREFGALTANAGNPRECESFLEREVPCYGEVARREYKRVLAKLSRRHL